MADDLGIPDATTYSFSGSIPTNSYASGDTGGDPGSDLPTAPFTISDYVPPPSASFTATQPGASVDPNAPFVVPGGITPVPVTTPGSGPTTPIIAFQPPGNSVVAGQPPSPSPTTPPATTPDDPTEVEALQEVRDDLNNEKANLEKGVTIMSFITSDIDYRPAPTTDAQQNSEQDSIDTGIDVLQRYLNTSSAIEKIDNTLNSGAGAPPATPGANTDQPLSADPVPGLDKSIELYNSLTDGVNNLLKGFGIVHAIEQNFYAKNAPTTTLPVSVQAADNRIVQQETIENGLRETVGDGIEEMVPGLNPAFPGNEP